MPEKIPECSVSFKELKPSATFSSVQFGEMPFDGFPPDYIDVSRLIVETKLAKSRSEATRFIEQGSVSIDGEKINNNAFPIKSGSIIKVGKHRFAKVINID